MSKKISINPSFFKIGGKFNKKEKKKKKKPNLKSNIKPNDIKKKLIARIKEHQKKERDKEIETEKNEDKETFKNEFNETLQYLQSIKEKKINQKKNKKKFKTLKNKNIDIEPMNTQKEPPYGCLKGGNKPTWKQYNKTLKKNKELIKKEFSNKKSLFNILNNNDSIDINTNDTNSDDTNSIRKEKLKNLQEKFKSENNPIKPRRTKIKTKRIKRKITLGKNNNRISVLIKNKKTRKNIKNEINILKKKSIQEVKNYLRKHNLIKIGSSAPDYILRNIYESSFLSGDVKNKNAEILLHNWHKEES